MTAANAYHCCIMDIMNDATWLRLDSPDLRGLNGLTLEPQAGEDYLMASPLFYPIIAPYQPMTAADAYHCCIMDIMNDATWLRLDPLDLKGLNRLTLEPRVGRRLPDGIPTFLSNN
eukprot:scaffold50355_cov72-Cyclotella_meneghiniana.AAC.1